MSVNKNEIIDQLSGIEIYSNPEGLIPAFGLLMQQLPSSFWNIFSSKIVKSVGEDLYESAAGLLINAAHECGYHTAYGVINSEEYQAVVEPMIDQNDSQAETIKGLFGVFSAWGWGDVDVIEVSKEKLVIEATSYYESNMQLNRPCAYMIQGVCAGFMDLVYGQASFPEGFGSYQCTQTKGIENGDKCGEFIVIKNGSK